MLLKKQVQLEIIIRPTIINWNELSSNLTASKRPERPQQEIESKKTGEKHRQELGALYVCVLAKRKNSSLHLLSKNARNAND